MSSSTNSISAAQQAGPPEIPATVQPLSQPSNESAPGPESNDDHIQFQKECLAMFEESLMSTREAWNHLTDGKKALFVDSVRKRRLQSKSKSSIGAFHSGVQYNGEGNGEASEVLKERIDHEVSNAESASSLSVGSNFQQNLSVREFPFRISVQTTVRHNTPLLLLPVEDQGIVVNKQHEPTSNLTPHNYRLQFILPQRISPVFPVNIPKGIYFLPFHIPIQINSENQISYACLPVLSAPQPNVLKPASTEATSGTTTSVSTQVIPFNPAATNVAPSDFPRGSGSMPDLRNIQNFEALARDILNGLGSMPWNVTVETYRRTLETLAKLTTWPLGKR